MRIAFVSSMYGSTWGGSEELWGGAALRLRELGHEVFCGLIDWPGPAPQRDALRKAGCRVEVRTDVPGLKDRVLNRFRRTARKINKQDPVPAALADFRPDLVVISQMFTDDGLEWMEFCRARGLAYVTIVQAASEYVWPGDELVPRLRQGYLGADAAFFVSRHNLELCEKQLAIGLANARVVRNPFARGLDEPVPWPAPADGVFRLACIGRLQPDAKGQDVAIDVLSSPKWRERPVALTFFGKGCNRQWVEDYSRLKGLEVRFGGFATPREIWAGHHLLLHPARKEGMPIVVLEAALCGRGVVATAAAGIPEFVEDGVNGYLASFAKPELVDRALERAWQERGAWEALGRRARQAALRHVGDDPIEVFADLLAGLAGGGRLKSATPGAVPERAEPGKQNGDATS